MYALAINNGGTIRATTVQQQGGHVYLTSDSGTIVNTGTVNASATAAKAAGGQITLKTTGTVVNHGSIIAHGGQGGTGGTVDLSGGVVDFTGGVDLTTPGGTTGSLLLDPSSIDITTNPFANGTVTTTGSTTTYTPAPGFTGTSELYNQTLDAQLAIANVIVNGVNNVTVNAPITWGDTTASTPGNETASTLTLQTTAGKGTIVINAAITGHEVAIPPSSGPTPPPSTLPKATLVIDCAGNGFVTTGYNVGLGIDGSIDVDNFTLKNGLWQQIVSANAPTAQVPGYVTALPGFNVTNDFQLLNTSTFERFNGGNGLLPTAKAPGNAPYAIDDIFALQGHRARRPTRSSPATTSSIPTSPPTTPSTGMAATAPTAGQASSQSVKAARPFQPFRGTFNGNNFEVDGLYIYRPQRQPLRPLRRSLRQDRRTSALTSPAAKTSASAASLSVDS